MTRTRPELCIALDGSDRRWILDAAHSLGGTAAWLKIGLEAFVAHGPRLVREVVELAPQVFLDLKLHDIPATVRRAAANVAGCGARMITAHAAGGPAMLEAAVAGARDGGSGSPPRIVAVTLLTSLDAAALDELGLPGPAEARVVRWARIAQGSGVDGVVASAREAAAVRAACGPDFLIVTPGIRPAGHELDDQRRAATPAEAVRAGADILVVGRPITGAAAPLDAARRILEEMAEAASE